MRTYGRITIPGTKNLWVLDIRGHAVGRKKNSPIASKLKKKIWFKI
jgi:hypothetical protein